MFCNCCFFSFFRKKKNQLPQNQGHAILQSLQQSPHYQQLLQQTQQLVQATNTQNFFSLPLSHQNLNNQTLPQAVQQQLFANQNLNNVEQLYQQFFVTYQNQAFNKPPVSYFPCQQDG